MDKRLLFLHFMTAVLIVDMVKSVLCDILTQ